MNATKFIGLILLIALTVIGIGLYIVSEGEDLILGHKLVGFATVFIFFVLMPAFIFVRYRRKDLSKFSFNTKTKEQKEEEEDDDWDDKSRCN